MKWKEGTQSLDTLGLMTEDKKNTWVNSCEECSKRDSEIMVVASELLGVELLDEDTRKILQNGLRHLRKIRDEERAAEEILEEGEATETANGRLHCLRWTQKKGDLDV